MRMTASRYCLLIALSAGTFYALALALSFPAFPARSMPFLDTAEAHGSLYSTPPRYAVYNNAPVMRPGAKYIVIGGSPALLGLRPGRLSQWLGGKPVHNLSLNSPDMSELAQEIRLLCDPLSPERRRETTLILGIDYLQFVDRRRRWTSDITDIDSEAYRYGLYSEADGIPQRRFGERTTRTLTFLLRPLMMFAGIYDEDILPFLTGLKDQARLAIGDPVYEFEISSNGRGGMSDRDRQNSIAMWRNYIGPDLSPAQFQVLAETARYAGTKGIRLLIVDLPLPAWHTQAIAYHQAYERRKAAILPDGAMMPGVFLLDLTDADAESDFFDSVHPADSAARVWEKRVAGALAVMPDRSRP
jgi:hypothetical protein